MSYSVREATASDIPRVVSYFLDADVGFLTRLGVDPARLPDREQWIDALCAEIAKPLTARERYYLIWEVDGVAVGHSNLSDIEHGRTADMHLHIWEPDRRRRGLGSSLLKDSIDRYFEAFQLETLQCEPHALNQAPNRTLLGLGFEYVGKYFGIPGSICYAQDVNQWRLTREQWMETRPSSPR